MADWADASEPVAILRAAASAVGAHDLHAASELRAAGADGVEIVEQGRVHPEIAEPRPAGAETAQPGLDDAESEEPGGVGEPAPAENVPLPEPALKRAVSLAADALGAIPTTEVPPALRRVAKFAPSRRARLGFAAIAQALRSDVAFRQRTGEAAAARWPGAAAALREAGDASGIDPVELAAAAYLLRPTGWASIVALAAERMTASASQQSIEDRLDQSARLREQLEALRASSLVQLATARAEQDELKAINSKLRQRLGATREALRVAERRIHDAEIVAAASSAAAAAATRDGEVESRRLRARVAELESSLESTRRAGREGRTTESIRARLLLDTMVEAAQGLRRELALPTVVTRPADLLADTEAGVEGVDDVSARGRALDDPSLLRQLLELPLVHLIIDGYNVTKTGYGELPLDAQRTRLLASLGALAARTAAEVTVVFDGAALDGAVRAVSSAAVRVRFSPPGVTADDVIRDLVRAEPVGRPLVVVSADREVADSVRRSGARPIAARALLRLLEGR